MLALLFFAFFAGMVTVLSPCILPVLPAVLAGSTMEGKRRALGIVCGVIVSFTFFTLALTTLVQSLGLSANTVRYVAIALIVLFGLVMLFPRLSEWFARISSPIARLGSSLQDGASNGFLGGVLFGSALGLVWTPCAGPILAAVASLVATHAISASTVLLTLAYSIGAAVPLFLIIYGGSQIVASSRWLSRHAENLRRFFGALLIIMAAAMVMQWDLVAQQAVTRWLPAYSLEDNAIVIQQLQGLYDDHQGAVHFPATGALSDIGPAPDLEGIANWINSPPLTIAQLKGKVVLIDFWTYTCINCLRTLPYLEKWDKDYRDKGLVIIGVHTPEFEFEKDPKNVAEAAAKLGVRYPIAQDNAYATWKAYGNHYWPAHYLIDQNGNVRMVHFGEGAYVETENAIRQLLGLQALEMKEPVQSVRRMTPETYLGFERAERYVSDVKLKHSEVFTYTHSGALPDDQVGLKGAWKVEGEYITAMGDDSVLDLNFLAKRVYLVLAGSSNIPLNISVDGKLVGQVTVDGDRKYDIADVSYGRHQLSLKVPKGVRAYAFTYGDE